MQPTILCLLVASAFALPGAPVTAVAAPLSPHTMPVSVPIADPVVPVAGANAAPKNAWWDRWGRWHPDRPQRPQRPDRPIQTGLFCGACLGAFCCGR